jgi:CheY-like chemotaxis protein/anti-sigma regulatory factor (Ser/Thr protein kinase)
VLRNLVGNALKFTTEGEVRCRAAIDPVAGRVEITVTDTGIGIPPEHQEQVFEEFFQVPGEAQTRSRGSGLGLPYARRVATILGGSLTLASTPGEGTTVTVRLPLPPDPARAPRRLGRVLVVDDDPAFRQVLRGILAPHVAALAEAPDGPAALAALHAGPPDLVLLDLQIPPPTGREVLARMRGDHTLREVPVVVVTSATPTGAERAALEETAVVLDKAELDAERLLAAADTAIRAVAR